MAKKKVHVKVGRRTLANNPDRCKKLWEYVDNLRLWGRQRIFLYEINKDYFHKLKSQNYKKEKFVQFYNKPRYPWDATSPFLAGVRLFEEPGSGTPLLIFKLIENRKFQLDIDGKDPDEERSTNFFIVNLQSGHAELRIQELHVGAEKDILEERDRLIEVIKEYLDFGQFRPIELVHVMEVMERNLTYPITYAKLKFSEQDPDPEEPRLLKFINKLFQRSAPLNLTAYRHCDQDILGPRDLHFRLNSTNDYIDIKGLADPSRIREITEKLVDIRRNPSDYPPPLNTDGIPPTEPIFKKGLISGIMNETNDQPKAQAVILSAGAIAASVIWILVETFGNYAFDLGMERIFGSLTIEIFGIFIEIAWIIWYYGWIRVWRGIKTLSHLPNSEVLNAILNAKKRADAH